MGDRSAGKYRGGRSSTHAARGAAAAAAAAAERPMLPLLLLPLLLLLLQFGLSRACVCRCDSGSHMLV